jgi:hypothetical protein
MNTELESFPNWLERKKAEEREKIFFALMEDFSEVIRKHLPSFDNNIGEDTWTMLEVFTEEIIHELG